MNEPQKCLLSESTVENFKLEILLLNQKYDFLMEMKNSNFFQVNYFLQKISFGLGWWLVVITLFFDFFLNSLFSSSFFRVILGK